MNRDSYLVIADWIYIIITIYIYMYQYKEQIDQVIWS